MIKHPGALSKEIEEDIKLTPDETKRLFKRFARIDADKSGGISVAEILSLDSAADNPLASRVLEIFDTDKSGCVDFNEFVSGMSIFIREGFLDKKMQFMFRVYDLNDDGFISNGDLFRSLKIMIGDNLEDYKLQQIVDKTIREADLDGDGKISFEEFELFNRSNNQALLHKMSIEGIL